MKVKISMILGYILCILFEIIVAVKNYSLFMKTYGKASFAKGAASIVVFWMPYLIIFIAFTALFIFLWKKFGSKK